MTAQRLADEGGRAVFENPDGRILKLLLDPMDDGADIAEDFDAWWNCYGVC